MDTNKATDAATIYKGTFDRGSCCNSKIEFTKLTGFVGTAAAPITWAAGTAGEASKSANNLGA